MLKPPAWLAGTFEWNADYVSNVAMVSFTIREPFGDNTNMDLISRLNRSPILGDVVENKNALNRGGFSERKVTLKARYDTPEEKVMLEKERERELEKEREKKREMNQRKETEVPVEDMEDDEAKE